MNYYDFLASCKDSKNKEIDGYDAIIAKWKDFREYILSFDENSNEIEYAKEHALKYNSNNEFFKNDDYSLRQFIERICAEATIEPSKLGLWVTGTVENPFFYYNYDEKTSQPLTDGDIITITKNTYRFLKQLITNYKWKDLQSFFIGHSIFGNSVYSSFLSVIVILNSFLEDEDLTREEKSRKEHFDYQNQLSWTCMFGIVELKKFTDEFGKFKEIVFDSSGSSPFEKAGAHNFRTKCLENGKEKT